MILVPVGGDDQIGARLIRLNGRGKASFNAKDTKRTVAQIGIDIDLCAGWRLEDKAGAAQPPSHDGTGRHLGLGNGVNQRLCGHTHHPRDDSVISARALAESAGRWLSCAMTCCRCTRRAGEAV